MTSFFRKLRWLVRRSDREADLRGELQFHMDEDAEGRREAGLADDQARRAARRDLGNLALVGEDARAAWGWRRLEQFVRDAGYGLRQIRRNPVFAGLAIATLALGISGVAAMFSAVDAVLIRPLPYTDAGRLVMIWDDLSHEGIAKHFPATGELFEWRRQNTVFTEIAATQAADATLSGDGEPEQVPARKTTSNLWSVLGVSPLIGRGFTEDEDTTGAKVVVISYGLWQRRYGGSADVLGRTITVNDSPYEVIGVMPREFYFMPARDIDIWMPTSMPPWMRTASSWHDLQVVARLKPGVALAAAQESMGALSLRMTANDERRPHTVVVTPLREEMLGKTGSALVVLLSASGALLLIACVNLANLLMVRGAARGREVAVRVALGAGRGRLIAQFLTESLVLAGFGTLAALVLALPAMRFLETLVPETMGAVRLSLDWRVLAFSGGVAVIAALMFGLVPALRGSRTAPQEALREGARGAAGPRSHWLQHSLIVIETALAVMLLTGAGLLLETFQHLSRTDLGMQHDKLLTFETPLFRYPQLDRRAAFVNAELEKIRAIPGVVNAGATSQLPLRVKDANATFYRFPGQSSNDSRAQVALLRTVSRDYFATIGANLREGRFFDSSDRHSESPAVVINETFANRHFSGRSAVGERFKYGRLNDKGYSYTIVGVVKEIHEVGMEEDARPAVYLLLEQADQIAGATDSIVVRTSVEPESIVAAVRAAIWSLDKDQPVAKVQTVDAMLARQLTTPSQSSALLSAFALLALCLASIGLYGVLSYAVTQRTNEIGLRMALGATSGSILRTFGGRGLALTLAGLAAGVVLSAIAARWMSTLFYGFQPHYVPTVAMVSVVLLTVAALACLVPARRASRIDPTAALQHQ